MSSLALIDEMLNHLGGTSTSTTTETDESNKTTNDIDTKDDDTKSNECDLITDTTLTLRGIPEFENYAHSSTDKFLFMADITAPLFKKKLNRAAIDLVCVLDESGSMDGDRIKLVKQTVEFIIKNLESTDRFGIIGFSSKSREILPLTLMNTNGKENALNECNKIKASGQTALCAGLIDGIQMLKKRNKENKNTIASVMLFTDGQANTGITNKIKILNQMDKYMFDNNNNNNNTIQLKNKKQLQKGEGEMDDDNEGKNEDENENIFSCSISTFGFGKDHNDTLLQEIAERGNGMYSFIETAEYISETFAEALGGLISICGQNLFVNIKALNGVIINKCKSKRFKKKTIIKGKQMQIIIPDIQSEEKRSLLFELTIPSMINNENDTNDMDDMDDMDDEKKNNENDKKDFGIIEFSVEYNNTIIGNKKEKLITVCTINRISGKKNNFKERNMELDIQNNRIIAADAMELSNNLAENNKLNEARKIIKKAQEDIKTSVSNDDTYCVTLIHDLEQCLKKLVSQYEYRSSGRQYMMMNSMSHHVQRSTQSTNCNNFSQMAYRNTFQTNMIQNFNANAFGNNNNKDKNQKK